MNEKLVDEILLESQKEGMTIKLLRDELHRILSNYEIKEKENSENYDNEKVLQLFIESKEVEGCSNRTLQYYKSSIINMLKEVSKNVVNITTEDIRKYLSTFQEKNNATKVTVDNIRRILSSFFSWLEDEDYILKSPVRRIHKVKTGKIVKEVFSDEEIEKMRDHCTEIRNLAMVDMLMSTGMRVGELVNLNVEDIDFDNRQCIVLGKGNSQREVYFDAKTKLHLNNYIDSRTDDCKALFVSLKGARRLTIGAVELCIRKLGQEVDIKKAHPHKFRRTLATMAIDKGMPIEQVQKLLGHAKIDTTMHYAMVNQNNVKVSHRKYIG